MRCIYRGAMGLFLSVRVCVFCLSISNQYYYYYYKTHGHSEKLWNFFKANQQHSGTAVFIHHHFFSIPHLLQCVCCFLMAVLLYVVCQYSAVPNWRPYQDILTEIVQFVLYKCLSWLETLLEWNLTMETFHSSLLFMGKNFIQQESLLLIGSTVLVTMRKQTRRLILLKKNRL